MGEGAGEGSEVGRAHLPVVICLDEDGVFIFAVVFLQVIDDFIQGSAGAGAADASVDNDMFGHE